MSELKFPEGKYMGTVKVGDKGQIVIPKPVRDMFNINPGDMLMVLSDKEHGIAIVAGDECIRIRDEILKNIKEGTAK